MCCAQAPAVAIGVPENQRDNVTMGAWDLGWEAVSAIAGVTVSVLTLGAVLLTARMARSADTTAKAALQQATSTSRPLIVPTGARMSERGRQVRVDLELLNAGAGPALLVDVPIPRR